MLGFEHLGILSVGQNYVSKSNIILCIGCIIYW